MKQAQFKEEHEARLASEAIESFNSTTIVSVTEH